MQMEIRFASWTRAGKFRVTFVRTNHISTIEGREPMIPLPCNSLTEMLREIYIPQKNLLKKKKNFEILNVPFFLKNETFSPRASISNPLQPPLLFASKTRQLLPPVEGDEKSLSKIIRHDCEARKLRWKSRDTIKRSDWLTSVIPNNVHPYVYICCNASSASVCPMMYDQRPGKNLSSSKHAG